MMKKDVEEEKEKMLEEFGEVYAERWMAESRMRRMLSLSVMALS